MPKLPTGFYCEIWQQALQQAWHIDYDENEVYDAPSGKKTKQIIL